MSDSHYALQPLIRRIEAIGVLAPDERQALLGLPIAVKVLRAAQEIVADGERTSQSCLLMEGWTFRSKLLAPGRRQIISFHVPGDIPDLHSLHLEKQDHSLITLTQSVVGFIPHRALRDVTAAFPGLAALLWRDTLIDAAIFREWIVGMGRRSAFQRIAHLCCELYLRLTAVGLAADHSCSMPMTQYDLADALGISTVHVSRTLKVLAERNIATIRGGRLTIHNWAELAAAAEFDPTYLHLRLAPAI